ncbi:MmcQ/YjbR family DNA-binding protein [Actinokineospora guangxiensis]|uniref:MmcQ/YjbR family DNA-binding protein n=1 Tax=Actinokineospora guangxiensis TaxID=1490288 RepID=A0ABW0ES92_9PSEU
MVDVEQVRRAALGLPGTTERPSYGTPGFRVKDRLFARVLDDAASLALYCADESEKQALIAHDPRVFFTTPHYDGYAMVLARLAELDEAALLDVLTESWRLRAPATLVADFDAG